MSDPNKKVRLDEGYQPLPSKSDKPQREGSRPLDRGYQPTESKKKGEPNPPPREP